ncbi:MAG TPA: hypothetical protein DF614_06575 [Methylococcaceae bacterium]|nr:hypothetical protein [Methylococcaceae bacterium]
MRINRNKSVSSPIIIYYYRKHDKFDTRGVNILTKQICQSRHFLQPANGDVEFTLKSCALDIILVAKNVHGACAVFLGDSPDVFALALQQYFPHARQVDNNQQLADMAAQLIDFIHSPNKTLTLTLDIHGTPFQKRVWQALQDIPTGQTATYRDIAQRINAPFAIRAVANACAANLLAIAIPCHRVVRSDGKLSGYRWGVARKAALLHRENAQATL